jgi:hypothetical protein
VLQLNLSHIIIISEIILIIFSAKLIFEKNDKSYTFNILDHFTGEGKEEMSLEWGRLTEEKYDLDLYKMQKPLSPGFPLGDTGHDTFTKKLLQQHRIPLSLRTFWEYFREIGSPKENSDEILSTSSSSTNYFSCFDSDPDDECEKDWRHFDVDFSNLDLCLNISVTHKQTDPRITIAVKAKTKQFASESSSWVSEEIEGDEMFYDTTDLSSSLTLCALDDESVDSSAMQSTGNKQNDKR